MAGEHILKLLADKDRNTRLYYHARCLTYDPPTYRVYSNGPDRIIKLIETEDEQEACRILKGG